MHKEAAWAEYFFYYVKKKPVHLAKFTVLQRLGRDSNPGRQTANHACCPLDYTRIQCTSDMSLAIIANACKRNAGCQVNMIQSMSDTDVASKVWDFSRGRGFKLNLTAMGCLCQVVKQTV